MKVAICLADKDPDLKILIDQMRGFIKGIDEKSRFIKKQHDDIAKEAKAQSQKMWRNIEECLKAKGLLPEEYAVSSSTEGLFLEEDTGVIYFVRKESSSDMEKFLKGLLDI